MWESLRKRFRRSRRLDRVVVIPQHESAVRRMVADASGEKYEALTSLEEAKTQADVTVVMQGDDGGSIYLTCPARLVQCDEATLTRLLEDLDRNYWNEPDMAGLFFERAPVGSGIAGGTGGGVVIEGVWLHPKLEAKGLRERVEAVIAGQRSRI